MLAGHDRGRRSNVPLTYPAVVPGPLLAAVAPEFELGAIADPEPLLVVLALEGVVLPEVVELSEEVVGALAGDPVVGPHEVDVLDVAALGVGCADPLPVGVPVAGVLPEAELWFPVALVEPAGGQVVLG